MIGCHSTFPAMNMEGEQGGVPPKSVKHGGKGEHGNCHSDEPESSMYVRSRWSGNKDGEEVRS